MRIPRNISGKNLIKRVEVLGYLPTRQSGSHVRLTTQDNGPHHITIPLHSELRVGTLNAIVSDIANHFKVAKQEIIDRLFA